jgi:hypothetical protein
MANQENESAQPDPQEIQVCEYIATYLDESNDDTPKRLAKIEALTKFLAFEQRVTELTDAEREHYLNCMEGPQLSEEMRKTLAECKTEKRKNYYLDMWARATYFTRCAWETYLYTGKNKPQIAQQKIPPAVLAD